MIDTHCHLDHPAIEKDIDIALKKAQSRGIKAIVTMATDQKNSQDVISITKNYPIVWGGVGIYPHQTNQKEKISIKKQIDIIDKLAGEKKVVAIGEIGLDFTDPFPQEKPRKRGEQQKLFLLQLKIAQKHQLPVSIHCRKAYPEMIGILTMAKNKHLPGVIHCFSGNKKQAEQLINLGFCLGITGNITYSQGLAQIIKSIPLKYLVLETDAPFLAPVPKRGEINQPAYINYTYKFVFEIINKNRANKITFPDFVKRIRKNALAVFNKINLD